LYYHDYYSYLYYHDYYSYLYYHDYYSYLYYDIGLQRSEFVTKTQDILW